MQRGWLAVVRMRLEFFGQQREAMAIALDFQLIADVSAHGLAVEPPKNKTRDRPPW
jgi:hypothetical protein